MKKHIFPIIAATMALASCSHKADYDATGIFEATTVTVSAETAGKITFMPVEEGDSINIGSTICDIDTISLALQRSQFNSQQQSTRDNIPEIPAQAAALRSQIQHQQTECARIEKLYKDGATTQQQRDNANATLRTLRGQLEALMSQLSNSTKSLSKSAAAINFQADQIDEMIRKSHVVSPISATILEKYAEAGEYATPGRPLIKIANLNDIYLRSYFTCDQLANIKIGQKVKVIADFGGDNQYEYPGTITWIAKQSEFTPKSIQTRDSRATLVYAVKIKVENDGRLKLGQYGEVVL